MSDGDFDALAARLSRALPGAPAVRISGVASLGAQRQTHFLEIGDAGITRPAVAQIAAQVIDQTSVADEAKLLRAAIAAGVPVPEILAVDEEVRAIVSARVEGETIPRRILRLIEAEPDLGSRLASDCGHALAAIHRIPIALRSDSPSRANPADLPIRADLPDLDDYTDPLRYAAQLEELLDSLSAPHPIFRLGIRWLRRFAKPPPRTPSLIHGDFRLGNLIVTNAGLAAVLDWELAHLGDPMEDLAWLCLRTWRFGLEDREVGGFARLDALRRAYEEAGGVWRADAFNWWTVARTLWWGLGLARQAQAFLEGASDSIVLAASGRRVVELEYDLLRLIAPGTRIDQ